MIGVLLLMFAVLAAQSAAEEPEVMATVGVQLGNIIGEAVVMDEARELTMRHNYRTDSLEDFNTGFVAMKNVRPDGQCAVMRMARGRRAQAAEKQSTKAAAGRLNRIRVKVLDGKKVDDVAALAGENIAEFCAGREVVELLRNGNAEKRELLGSILGWIKDNVELKINVGVKD